MPLYEVEIDGKVYQVESEQELSDEEAYSYAQQQQAPEEPITASTAGESFGKWAEEKKRQIAGTPSEKAQAVGGSVVDALSLLGRGGQAISAGLNAKRLGAGGFLETAGKQLAGGDTRLGGKDLADVWYGWEPESTTGKVVKSLSNIGRDIVGVSGPANLLGRGLRLIPGAAKAMQEAPEVLKFASQIPNIVENVAPNAIISPAIKGLAKIPGTVSRETYKLMPEYVKEGLNAIARETVNVRAGVDKGVISVGERATRLQNAANAFTNDIYLKAKEKFRGLAGDAANIEKKRLGDVIAGKAEPIDDIEKAARDTFVQKQAMKLAKIKEWQSRLKAIGVSGAFADTLLHTVTPDKFYHRVYELPPHLLSQGNIKKIVQSIDENIAIAAERGKKDVVDKLNGLKEAYLTKDADRLSSELGQLEFTDKVSRAADEDAMGLGKAGVFKARVLPEHLAQIFKPMTDVETLMKAERAVDNAYAAMEARVGLLEKQYNKTLPKAASPEEVDEFLDTADKAGIFRGIGDVIPDVRTDKVTYDYIAQKLGEVNELEKHVFRNPVSQLITNTWKTWKLFHPAAITRNFIQGSSLAAQHGINQLDYVPAVRTAYKMASGKMNEVPKDLRNIYSQLNGSGTSLSLSDVLSNVAVKTEKGNVPIDDKFMKLVRKSWDVLGQSFRSTDDGLRIAMFNKKVQEFADAPLEQAIKDRGAVMKAFEYVDQNTIKYDELPALARWMKLVNPFFAFTFRAPRQYLKAMAESPALTARFKTAGQRESEHNLEGTSPAIKNMYNAQRNLLAEALNTFGGNIVIGADGKINGIPAIDYIDMAPLSLAMRRPSAGIYNPTLGQQAVDIGAQMTGIDLSGKTPPVTPVGVASSLMRVIPAVMGEGKQSEDATRDIIQTLSPTLLTQVLSVVPASVYPALNLRTLGVASYPKRGGSPERNLLTALGVKTKAETHTDIAKNFKAAVTATIPAQINRAKTEADVLFPYDRAKNSMYVRKAVERTSKEGQTKLDRVLNALKGL